MSAHPSSDEAARSWLDAARSDAVARDLEAVYAIIADQVEARGPACWASGRCCNFDRTGHRLYTTGLEAAYTITRLRRPLDIAEIRAAVVGGGCPFQEGNLCGVHPIRPLGCRVYFCDRSAQDWQMDLSERAIAMVRELHDRRRIAYRYAEWRSLLALLAPESAP